MMQTTLIRREPVRRVRRVGHRHIYNRIVVPEGMVWMSFNFTTPWGETTKVEDWARQELLQAKAMYAMGMKVPASLVAIAQSEHYRIARKYKIQVR